jgi:hypothetical protein
VDPYDPASGYIKEPDQNAFYGNTAPSNQPGLPDEQPDKHQTHFSEAYNAEVETKLEKPVVISCRICQKPFESKNALHRHLPCSEKPVDLAKTVPTGISTAVEIVESSRHLDEPKGAEYLRTYRSCAASVGLNTVESYQDVCLDTGCSWTIIDADFARKIKDVRIEKTSDQITIKGIKSKDSSNEVAVFSLYFPGTLEGDRHGFAKIDVRAYLVDNLQPNILVGTEVLVREGFVFDFENLQASIGSCQMLTFPVHCLAEKNRVKNALVVAQKQVTVQPYSRERIPIKLRTNLPEGRDYIFEPANRLPGIPVPDSTEESGARGFAVYTHLVDHEFSFVEAVNDTDKPVLVARHVRLGTVSDSDYVTAYRVSVHAAELARGYGTSFSEPLEPPDNTFSKTPASTKEPYRQYVAQQFINANRVVLEKDKPERNNPKKDKSEKNKPENNRPKLDRPELFNKPDLENTTVLPNGITIYGRDPDVIARFRAVIERFNVWGTPETIGQINIPEDQWMEIPLKKGWEDRLPKPRIYDVGPKGRAEIDRMFDLLH